LYINFAAIILWFFLK